MQLYEPVIRAVNRLHYFGQPNDALFTKSDDPKTFAFSKKNL